MEQLNRRQFLWKMKDVLLLGAAVGFGIGTNTEKLWTEKEAWEAVGYESWPGKPGRYEWYQEKPPQLEEFRWK